MTKDGKIDWCSYFDSVVCVHYKPYDNRLPRLFEELTRVGLIDSRVFTISRIDHIDGLDAFHNLGFHTARIMDTFLDSGGSRLCVIENDLAFLRDLALLDSMLAAMPDSGIVQFDKFIPWSWSCERYRKFVEDNRVNDYFFDTDKRLFTNGEFFAGGSFYSVDRKAAYALRTRMVNYPCYPDIQLRHIGSKVYTADRNAAVQVMYKSGVSAKKWRDDNGVEINPHTRGYRAIGLSYDDYAVPSGYDASCLFYSPDAV